MSTEVTAQALKKSFEHLCQAAVTPADNMLEGLKKFYAAECGLKAAVMRRRNLRTTAQLGDLRSHGLLELAKELNLRPADYEGVASCRRTAAKGKQRVAVREMHEAWRYGAKVEVADQERFLAGLKSMIDWCSKELNQ